MSTTLSTNPQPMIYGFDQMGSEVFGNICGHLDFEDVKRLSMTSKRMYDQTSSYVYSEKAQNTHNLFKNLIKAFKNDSEQVAKIDEFQRKYFEVESDNTHLPSFTKLVYKVTRWVANFLEDLPLKTLLSSEKTINEIEFPTQVRVLRRPGDFNSYYTFDQIYSQLAKIPSVMEKYKGLKAIKPATRASIKGLNMIADNNDWRLYSETLVVTYFYKNAFKKNGASIPYHGFAQAGIDLLATLSATNRRKTIHQLATHFSNCYNGRIKQFLKVTHLEPRLEKRHEFEFNCIKSLIGFERYKQALEALSFLEFRPSARSKNISDHQKAFYECYQEVIREFHARTWTSHMKGTITTDEFIQLSIAIIKHHPKLEATLKLFEQGDIKTLLDQVSSNEHSITVVFFTLYLLCNHGLNEELIDTILNNSYCAKGSVTKDILLVLVRVMIEKNYDNPVSFERVVSKLRELGSDIKLDVSKRNPIEPKADSLGHPTKRPKTREEGE